MASPAAVLAISVRANTAQANAALARTDAQLKKTAATAQTSSSRAGKAATAMGGALAGAGKVGAVGFGLGLGFAVKKAADFEQQMSSLGSVTGASGRQMRQFKKQAMDAGAATKFSALEAAQAQTELAKGGLSVAQIMRGGLKSALALAAAGEMDLADAAGTTANAMKLFGLEGNQSMQVADALAAAANKTTGEVRDFALALKMGGSVARMAGLNLQETTAILMSLAEAGIKGSDAGTSMKAFFLNITTPSSKARKAMKELGVSIFDARGNLKSLPEVAQNLRAAFGDLTREQFLAKAGTIAGSDAVRTLYSIYAAGPKNMKGFIDAAGKSGEAAKIAAKKQDNLRGKLENLQGSIETIAISIGTKMIPSLTRYAEKITKILNDPKLTDSEKFDRVADIVSDAFSKAAPKVADAAAKIAPKVALAFVRGFANAGGWGKLFVGAFLLHKMGGIRAFFGIGAKGGAAMASGVAAGAGGGAAGGKLARGLGKLAPFAKRAGMLALGFAAIEGVNQAFDDPSKRANTQGKVQNFLHGVFSTVGLGDLMPKFDANKEFAKLEQQILAGKTGAQKVKTGFAKLFDTGPILGTGQKTLDIKARIDESGLNAQSKAVLQKIIVWRQRVTRIMGPGIQLKLTARPGDFGRIDAGMKNLRLGLLRSGQQIVRESSANFRIMARSMQIHSGGGMRKVAENMKLAARSVALNLGRGVISAREATATMATLMKRNTGKGKNAVTANFAAAARAIRRSVRDGTISVDQGTKLINALMAQAVSNLGLKPKAAGIHLDKGTGKTLAGLGRQLKARGGVVTKASGGLTQFGKAGAKGQDNIPVTMGEQKIAVGAGEVGAVINRHQMPILNQRLADYGGLGGFFQKNDRKHAMAKGGLVGRKGFAAGGIVALGRKLQKEGYTVGEHPAFGGVHPVHVPSSWHYKNKAIDVNADSMPGGEMKALDRLNSRLKRTKGVIELLWRVANHFDHLHVAMSGSGGALPGGGGGAQVSEIPRIKVAGPDSPLKVQSQRALDLHRSAANKKLGQLAATTEGKEKGGGLVDVKGGSVARTIYKVWQAKAMPPKALLSAIETGIVESGLRNLSGGDADSVGWRQERGHYGSVAERMNVSHGASRFFNEWSGFNSRGKTAGMVAADVQRPAAQFRGRYDAVRGQAANVIKNLGYRGAALPRTKGGLVGAARKPEAVRAAGGRKGWQGNARKLWGGMVKRFRWANNKGMPRITVGGVPANSGDTLPVKGWKDHIRLSPDIVSDLGKGVDSAENVTMHEMFHAMMKPGPAHNERATQAMVRRFGEGAAKLGGIGFKYKNTSPYGDGGYSSKQLVSMLEPGKRAARGKGKLKRSKIDPNVFPKRFSDLVAKFRGAADMTSEYAERAGQVGGPVNGASETEWIKRQLSQLLQLRNTILQAHAWIAKRQKHIALTIKKAEQRLRKTKTKTKAGKKLAKDRKAFIARNKTAAGKLSETDGGLMETLTEVHGRFAPMNVMRSLPKPGVLGGSILTAQLRLKELGSSSSATDAGVSERSDLLAQKLREANLRTAVSESHFKTLQSFGTGGIVQGRTGQALPAVVHAGEGVFTRDQMSAMGGGDVQVSVNVAPGMEWLEKFIDVKIEKGTRKQARSAARTLPGAR